MRSNCQDEACGGATTSLLCDKHLNLKGEKLQKASCRCSRQRHSLSQIVLTAFSMPCVRSGCKEDFQATMENAIPNSVGQLNQALEKLYLHDKSTKPLQAFEALEPQTQRLLAPLTEAQARQLVQITWPAMKRKVDYRVKKATEK